MNIISFVFVANSSRIWDSQWKSIFLFPSGVRLFGNFLRSLDKSQFFVAVKNLSGISDEFLMKVNFFYQKLVGNFRRISGGSQFFGFVMIFFRQESLYFLVVITIDLVLLM